jgi:hypothetical protein
MKPKLAGHEVDPTPAHFLMACHIMGDLAEPDKQLDVILGLTAMAKALYGWEPNKFLDFMQKMQETVTEVHGVFTWWIDETGKHWSYDINPPGAEKN